MKWIYSTSNNLISSFLFIIIAASSIFFLSGTEKPSHVNINEAKPYTFIFEDLDGNAVNLDEMYDKTVFLNFWASWCKPCVKEMPSIRTAQKELADTNYEFVLVSDENPMKIKAFKNRHKYPFMHLYSPESKKNFGVDVLPYTYVLKNGMVIAVFEGSYDWSSQVKIDQLRSLAQ